jgi:hypothetical protein
MAKPIHFATLLTLLSACSAENPGKSPDVALEPRPICGANALTSCLRDPPPLSDDQKKVFFAATEAQTRNAEVLLSFRTDTKPRDALAAELTEILRKEGCLKESAAGPDGRTTFKVIGERCPLASLATGLSTQQEGTQREEEGLDVHVTSEDFARKGGLRRLAGLKVSSSTTTDLGGKRLRFNVQGTEKSTLEATEEGKVESNTGMGIEAVADLSHENEIRIVSLRGGSVTQSTFPGFQAVLRVNIDLREDGTGAVEAFLNGEKIVGQRTPLANLALEEMRARVLRLAAESRRP